VFLFVFGVLRIVTQKIAAAGVINCREAACDLSPHPRIWRLWRGKLNIHRVLCTCLLVLFTSQLANATGGAVNLTLDQIFKDYEVQEVFIGEVRGFEQSQVHGLDPRDGSNANETRFRQYSYIQIKFRVVPSKVLGGDTEIGKPINLIFKEHDFSGAVTLKKNGTTEDTGPTAMGLLSTGSGNERKNQFSELGKKGIFIIGKEKGETDVRLLRVEHADQAVLEELE
jgi:hypothetical protein